MRILAAALLLLAAPAGAATITLDFEDEITGERGESFVSAECGGCVTFSRSDGFSVSTFGFLTAGEDEDQEGFQMDFAQPVDSLSLWFGNDGTTGEPDSPEAGDVARLTAYQGATLLGSASVVLNMNGLTDQSITLSGLGAFDRAYFRFESPGGGSIGIDERVDDISFATVPEPSALLLLALGSGLLVSARPR